MRKKEFIPMNLQLFAEPPAAVTVMLETHLRQAESLAEGSKQSRSGSEGDDGVSLAEQVAQLKVQNAKLKKANDKATSEAASYKKQLREKQTAEEIALQEKARKKPRGRNSFRSCFVKIQLQSLRRISLHLDILRIWLQRQRQHSVITTLMSFSAFSDFYRGKGKSNESRLDEVYAETTGGK